MKKKVTALLLALLVLLSVGLSVYADPNDPKPPIEPYGKPVVTQEV